MKRPLQEQRQRNGRTTWTRIQQQATATGRVRFGKPKPRCERFLDHLSDLLESRGIPGRIWHNGNGGERWVYCTDCWYRLDGYHPGLNIAFEWDERHHFRKGQLQLIDLLRQERIEKALDCKTIRIREGKEDLSAVLQDVLLASFQIYRDE